MKEKLFKIWNKNKFNKSKISKKQKYRPKNYCQEILKINLISRLSNKNKYKIQDKEN